MTEEKDLQHDWFDKFLEDPEFKDNLSFIIFFKNLEILLFR